MKRNKIIAGAIGVFLLLTAESCGPSDDRSGTVGNGTKPDGYLDATNVIVFRNADDVPNVVLFCIGKFRFASTLSGSNTESAMLIRLPEDDVACGGKPQ